MIYSADKEKYSPPEWNVIKDIQSDLPLVLVTRTNDFKFNEDLRKLDKYILVNMCEMGWNFHWNQTPIFGKNAEMFPELFPGIEWAKFNDWVCSNEPILTFQRELLQKDVWYDIVPIEYPSWQDSFPIQSKEEFNARPLDLCFMWGRSNEIRPFIHSEIWKWSGTMGWAVCDNPYIFNGFIANETGKKAVTFNLPHYNRLPIEQLLAINGMSKISISAKGNGIKCFRSTGEAGVNSALCMQTDNLAWTFPFIDNVNCIKFNKEPFPRIKEALENPNLYEIYLESIATAEKYRCPNYKKHLESIIQSVI